MRVLLNHDLQKLGKIDEVSCAEHESSVLLLGNSVLLNKDEQNNSVTVQIHSQADLLV